MIRPLTLASAVLSGSFVLALLAAPAWADRDVRDAVQNNAAPVHNTWGNCVRTKWQGGDDVCAPSAPPPPPPAAMAPPPAPVKHTVISEAQRTVYFPFNKAELTPAAKTQLDTLAETLKGAQDVREAHVLGTADRVGSVKYNDKLSQKRAEAVRDYLVARGYTKASVTKAKWIGKSKPTTSCGKKMAHKKMIACLQNDRRVEIEIVYRSEVEAPAK